MPLRPQGFAGRPSPALAADCNAGTTAPCSCLRRGNDPDTATQVRRKLFGDRGTGELERMLLGTRLTINALQVGNLAEAK